MSYLDNLAQWADVFDGLPVGSSTSQFSYRLPGSGLTPADAINPMAVLAMAEEDIDIAAEQPKILTTDAAKASEVVITMGCGETCPF